MNAAALNSMSVFQTANNSVLVELKWEEKIMAEDRKKTQGGQQGGQKAPARQGNQGGQHTGGRQGQQQGGQQSGRSGQRSGQNR